MTTTLHTAPTAVEALTLPVAELIAMIGADFAEIDPATLDQHGPTFLGTLIRRGDGSLLFGMPTGQDPEEREDVIRVLILRDIAPAVTR